jgi:hypothetical protein
MDEVIARDLNSSNAALEFSLQKSKQLFCKDCIACSRSCDSTVGTEFGLKERLRSNERSFSTDALHGCVEPFVGFDAYELTSWKK